MEYRVNQTFSFQILAMNPSPYNQTAITPKIEVTTGLFCKSKLLQMADDEQTSKTLTIVTYVWDIQNTGVMYPTPELEAYLKDQRLHNIPENECPLAEPYF